jgi:uncharacterized OsmC-like protein
MSSKAIAAAVRRVEDILRRRPSRALHDDAPATARWEGGTRVVASHANGTRVATDMPSELGGSGDCVTPGWVFRAGVASCAATTIAMRAAAAGIELDALAVDVHSKSDTRGLLGMDDEEGRRVNAGPCEMRLEVRISARGHPDDALRRLVEASMACSPMPDAVRNALPIALRVDVG